MRQTLLLEIPDTTCAEIQRSAEPRHQSPEDTALAMLENQLALSPTPESIESDPLVQLFGSIRSEVTDGAQRHDEYIGEELFRSLRNSR